MKTPVQIDVSKKTFISCGVEYYIMTESMSYDRLVRFISMIPELAYGVNFQELQSKIRKGMSILSSGNDLSKNYIDVYNHLLNIYESIKDSTNDDFFTKNIDLHLRFCGLFCVTAEEDLTVCDDRVIDRKIENWKKDMDMYSFFLLAKLQLPGFKEIYSELQNVSLEKVDSI